MNSSLLILLILLNSLVVIKSFIAVRTTSLKEANLDKFVGKIEVVKFFIFWSQHIFNVGQPTPHQKIGFVVVPSLTPLFDNPSIFNGSVPPTQPSPQGVPRALQCCSFCNYCKALHSLTDYRKALYCFDGIL